MTSVQGLEDTSGNKFRGCPEIKQRIGRVEKQGAQPWREGRSGGGGQPQRQGERFWVSGGHSLNFSPGS